MNKLEQIKAHIDWCIKMGVLPRNYKKTAEYKELIKSFEGGTRYDN